MKTDVLISSTTTTSIYAFKSVSEGGFMLRTREKPVQALKMTVIPYLQWVEIHN